METTWSHILGRKFSKIREERGMTLDELWKKVWTRNVYVGNVLRRTQKWNEEIFYSIWEALWVPLQQVSDMIVWAMFEAIEQEYWTWFTFALKSQFWLSDWAVKDVLKFIADIQKREGK